MKLLSTIFEHSSGGVAANIPNIVGCHMFTSRATRRLLYSSRCSSCESGVLGQRARLLIWRSAQVMLLR